MVNHHSASASSSNHDITDAAKVQLAIWHGEMEAAMLAKRKTFLKASIQTSKVPTIINHKDPSSGRVLSGKVANNNCTRSDQHRDVKWGMTSGRQYSLPITHIPVKSVTLERLKSTLESSTASVQELKDQLIKAKEEIVLKDQLLLTAHEKIEELEGEIAAIKNQERELSSATEIGQRILNTQSKRYCPGTWMGR